jgi:hypothetical protein
VSRFAIQRIFIKLDVDYRRIYPRLCPRITLAHSIDTATEEKLWHIRFTMIADLQGTLKYIIGKITIL